MTSPFKIIFSVAILTLASRVISLIALLVYMAFFGPQDIRLNIYAYALNIPNMVFNVFWAGIVAVIVPIYTGFLAKNETARARAFLNDMITIICVFVLMLVTAGLFAAPFIASFTEYVGADFAFLVVALRVMFSVVLFYTLQYVFQGFLHSHGKFRLAAFVEVPSGLLIIGYVIFLGDTFGVGGLLVTTAIGLSMRVLLLMPAVVKTGLRYRPSFNIKSPDVVRAGLLFVPIVVSGLSFQTSMLVNTTLATRFNAVPILLYVQNLIFVVILTVVYSITAVYLPKLSALWAVNDKSGFTQSFRSIVMILIFLMIPATAGFFMLRFEIINFLSGWGNFDVESVRLTADMLGIYSLGIVAVALKEMFDRGFYAQKNSKFPALFSVMIMLVNVMFCFAFIGRFGVFTMAMGFPISTTIGVVGLVTVMNRRVSVLTGQVMGMTVKALLATGVMIFVLYFSLPLIREITLPSEILMRFFVLVIPIFIGVGVYFTCAYFLRMSQVRDVVSAVVDKMRGGEPVV